MSAALFDYLTQNAAASGAALYCWQDLEKIGYGDPKSFRSACDTFIASGRLTRVTGPYGDETLYVTRLQS